MKDYPKQHWYGVFTHGLLVAAFASCDAAERWGQSYFATNTPWDVQPIQDVSENANTLTAVKNVVDHFATLELAGKLL